MQIENAFRAEILEKLGAAPKEVIARRQAAPVQHKAKWSR